MTKLLQALRQFDLEEPKGNIDSGRMHRWGRNNRCWARRFAGGYVFGDFVSGLSTHVFDREEQDCGREELRALRISMAKARKEAEIEQARIYEESSARASAIWNGAKPSTEHAYLSRKRVFPMGYANTKEVS
ncbi:MAG: hypothetical protein LBG04_03105 [Holosporaceae bacterium]|jgi:hypothetical protein|nr:hypothetical protein [Holosporaceae bacterium]